MLTDLQRVVLARLRRRNSYIAADEAERCWNQGRHTHLDARNRWPRWLRQLFVEANDEAIKASPKVAERNSAHEWKIVAVRESPSPDELAHCDTPQQAVEYWLHHVATAPHFSAECECFAVLLLNIKKRVRGHHLVSIGMLNEAMAHPREVFRAAVIGGAHSVVLMHNHPSGESDPSNADRQMTKVLADSGRILRIEVVDHVIVGHGRYCSFREMGLFGPT